MLISDPSLWSFKSPRGFVVLEGVNGAGKSTLQRRLADFASGQGRRCLPTFEPGATALGAVLRKALLEGLAGKLESLSELLLFSADRHEHVAKVIRPALSRGELVISDRFHYSTTAFQGFGRGLDLRSIREMNRLAVGGTNPDMVILLDLDPRIGLRRGKERDKGELKDGFEAEELAFHQRLRDGFLLMAKEADEPFLVVTAEKAPEEIFNEVLPLFEKLLKSLEQPGR